jgi:LmbE family N-acetylglucosaminyl deacetylase
VDVVGERQAVNVRFPRLGTVVALGAHPDDIEIGAGGTLHRLFREVPDVQFVFVVATGSATRRAEATESARHLLEDRVTVHLLGAGDGMLPYRDPVGVKEWMRGVLPQAPDLVFAPWRLDRHQDHRFVADLAWQLCRGATILQYGIPKWESEPFSPNVHVRLSLEDANRKIDHLMAHFPSQHDKPWYRRELFAGSLSTAGIGAGSDVAEGFVAESLVFA